MRYLWLHPICPPSWIFARFTRLRSGHYRTALPKIGQIFTASIVSKYQQGYFSQRSISLGHINLQAVEMVEKKFHCKILDPEVKFKRFYIWLLHNAQNYMYIVTLISLSFHENCARPYARLCAVTTVRILRQPRSFMYDITTLFVRFQCFMYNIIDILVLIIRYGKHRSEIRKPHIFAMWKRWKNNKQEAQGPLRSAWSLAS